MMWCANENECNAISKFAKEHYEKCSRPLGKKAPPIMYRVLMYGTGIGTNIEVECLICGKKERVTDVSNW